MGRTGGGGGGGMRRRGKKKEVGRGSERQGNRNRQTDIKGFRVRRETDKQTKRETETEKWTDGHTDRSTQTHQQMNKGQKKDRQREKLRQTGRQMDGQTDRRTDRQTCVPHGWPCWGRGRPSRGTPHPPGYLPQWLRRVHFDPGRQWVTCERSAYPGGDCYGPHLVVQLSCYGASSVL